MHYYHHICKPHICSSSHHWFGQEQKARCSYVHAGTQRKHEEQLLLDVLYFLCLPDLDTCIGRMACAIQLGCMRGGIIHMDTRGVRGTESIGA